jgi:hypothetical protein
MKPGVNGVSKVSISQGDQAATAGVIEQMRLSWILDAAKSGRADL